MSMTVLYCNDPVWPRRVDAHFAAEYRLVRELGGDSRLIDHDAIARGDVDAAIGAVPHGLGTIRYRGWMMTSPQYTALYEGLQARGATLATDPEQFRAAHEFPGWYAHFASVTPVSVWSSGVPDAAELFALAGRLPGRRAMVKDYVKSRKDHPGAFLIPNTKDESTLDTVVSTFVDLQGADLCGGVVLRSFEDFEGVGDRAYESRIWWYEGVPVVIGPHPDHPNVTVAPELGAIAPLVASFPSRFITTDLARRADGTWRLIEVGDAQVSDFPRGTDIRPLLRALLE
ncbi:ATP-grasp domain-containing protein [Stackebrandtia soli]|uniref:ATP-grasp domain-containing protein n=1 Tax=Stackebrandtia soli TaxID=1892856 RepID=UPI0039EBCCCB